MIRAWDVPRQSAKRKDKPTNAEVGILRVLWSRGPSTVREVARSMGREAEYTTILKLLQNMTAKRLVRRDESARSHVYTAANPEEQTQRADCQRPARARLRGLGGKTGDAGAGGERHVAERARGNPETDRHPPKGTPMTLQLNGWLDTIGWTLVHFLWQGTVIGVVIAGVLAVCRARASSQARYLVACIGLFALLAAPIATTVMLRSSPSASVRPQRCHICSTCVRADVTAREPARGYANLRLDRRASIGRRRAMAAAGRVRLVVRRPVAPRAVRRGVMASAPAASRRATVAVVAMA